MTDSTHPTLASANSTRPRLLLLAGLTLGVVLAATGLLTGDSAAVAPLSSEIVARVNDQLVRRDDYDRLLQALATDRRAPIDDEQRRHVLDRLIEEELLIQRALALGLAHHDSRIRKDLTLAMIDSVVAEYRDLEPTDDELRTFFEDNGDFFARSGRFRVRQIWCRAPTLADGDAAYVRAREAAEKLQRGDPFEEVLNRHGDIEIAPLPDALLPASKLADYLGPTALRTVMGLEAGETSDPIRSSTGYHVLQLVERGAASLPDFETIRDQVRTEYRRRSADDALRDYLNDLRSRADVELAEDML